MYSKRPLAFVDLETTGATANIDRITEIGIVEVDPDGEVREWQQLVNPGLRISPFIQNLTGISNEMVSEAPAFEQVAQEVFQRLEGRLFIAHNARFDYGFLKNEFSRAGLKFRAPVLCTVKLSRLLYPEFHRHNLDILIERHALVANARHRALADAQLIHQFWKKIWVDRGDDAVNAAIKKLDAHPSLPPHLDPTSLQDLPDTSGVYYFYGENALPLYVGKAKNLRKRVFSHFSADHRSAKEMSLAQQVRRITWTETAGEIGALLQEAMEVKHLLPTHNRQLRRNDEVCTWTLVDEGNGWLRPELIWAQDLAFGIQTACYGLFRSAKEANEILRGLSVSHQLCDVLLGLEKASQGKPCFGFQVKRCKGGCVGHEPVAKHTMRLMSAMVALKLVSWPFAGPAIIREGNAAHVIDAWRYLGTAQSDEDIHALLEGGRPAFDRDTYKILSKYVSKMTPFHA